MARALVVSLVGVAGCILEPNPEFFVDGGTAAVTGSSSAGRTTLPSAESNEGPTPGSGGGPTSTSSVSSASATSSVSSGSSTWPTWPTVTASGTGGVSDPTGEESGADESTGPTAVDLAVDVIELGPTDHESRPQLAWSGSELGVTWDVHQRFARFQLDGSMSGLSEFPINYDAKSPSLTALGGTFFAGFANYNSHVLLLRRPNTDEWESLGRKDQTNDSLGVRVEPFGEGLVMAWRELVLEFTVVTMDAEGEILAMDQRPLGSSHRPLRFLETADELYILILQDLGERKLLRYDHALNFQDLHSVNDGPVDLAWDDGEFEFVSSRDAGLVFGRFDGQSIQGELTALDPDPGSVQDIRILGGDGRYLVAWRTREDDVDRLRLGRIQPDTPFEFIEVAEGVERLTDLISTGATAAVGWSAGDIPYIGLIQW